MRRVAVDGSPGLQSSYAALARAHVESCIRCGEVRPHAQVAPSRAPCPRALAAAALGVAVLDDGRARGPLGPAAREELDGRDLARRRAVVSRRPR